MNFFLEIFRDFGTLWKPISYSWWFVLPPLFYYVFKFLWMDFVVEYSDDGWVKKLEWVYLEFIPPKEIEKSPKVMESLYAGIAGVVVTIKPFDMYLKGAFTDRFSFEIVGEEGTMHFYARVQKKYRNLVEAQIYAQFPDAQIFEVEDYTKKFPRVIPNKHWDLWGADIESVMPSPYPIKTYDKFEEDITGTMIDPLAAMAEVIGKLGPGQHIWLQFVIEPFPEKWKNEDKEVKTVMDKLTGRNTAAPSKNILQHLIDVLVSVPKALFSPIDFSSPEKKEQSPLEFRLTPIEKEVLKAVEENIGKNTFKTKMRLLLVCRKEVFDKSIVSSFFGTIKQFNEMNLNNLKPNDASKTYADYIAKKGRLAYRQRKIYRRYRDRDMDGKKVIFSTKELATLFHFPNMEVKSPSVARIDTKRGSAPFNLPVQSFDPTQNLPPGV